MTAQTVHVRLARWPRDLSVARALLRDYEAHLRTGPHPIHLDEFAAELAGLAERWGGERAALLLATLPGGTPCGCVAVQLLADPAGAAEIKRMWVSPEARGHGAGQALGESAIGWARAHGATELLLDTHPATMPEAGRLYARLGFQPHHRYNQNPVSGVAFFRLPLANPLETGT